MAGLIGGWKSEHRIWRYQFHERNGNDRFQYRQFKPEHQWHIKSLGHTGWYECGAAIAGAQFGFIDQIQWHLRHVGFAGSVDHHHGHQYFVNAQLDHVGQRRGADCGWAECAHRYGFVCRYRFDHHGDAVSDGGPSGYWFDSAGEAANFGKRLGAHADLSRSVFHRQSKSESRAHTE